MGFKNKVAISKHALRLAFTDKLSWLLVAWLLGAQWTYGQEVNPLEGDPRAARVGGSIFRAQCATCHGADAKGIDSIDAPDLTLVYAGTGTSDESVFDKIRNGVPGSIMPAHTFPDTEIWMLVSYLRSIGVSGISSAVDGNPDLGRTLFSNNCAACHRKGNEGGALGPNLSKITEVRSLEALISSIRNPSFSISRGYKPVSITTSDSQQIQGVIKREDAFSIQIMDANQFLRAFSKMSLKGLEYEEQSLMPVFSESLLSDTELRNIISFLQSSL